MQRALIATLFLQLSAGAFGACSAGYKAKANLAAGTFCSLSTQDGASCNSNCCEADTTTCGGALAAQASLACPFDSYHGSDDAWKSIKAYTTKPTGTAANAAAELNTWQTKCCVKKATCGAAPTCPAGWKAKTGVSTTMCSTDAASCLEVSEVAKTGACCELNADTCGGHMLGLTGAALADRITAANGNTGCGANAKTDLYMPATAFSDASLMKKACTTCGTPANFQAACCETKSTCGSTHYSCPAGSVRSKDKATLCGGNAASCAAKTECCVVNGCESYVDGTTKKLKSVTTPADADCTGETYYPGYGTTGDGYWKAKFVKAAIALKPTVAELQAACCTPKATCKNGVVPSGYKKKANSDKLSCSTDAASCATASKLTCFEADTTKCGGLKGITCPYGTYNEAHFHVTSGPKSAQTPQATIDAWNNKPATEATKNTACCTAKAVCTGVAATTTPAATVTPATAIRRYSEHKVVQEGSDHPMVWLGVGGLIGMSVLMAVQGLRSRMSAETTVAEDGDRLLQ